MSAGCCVRALWYQTEPELTSNRLLCTHHKQIYAYFTPFKSTICTHACQFQQVSKYDMQITPEHVHMVVLMYIYSAKQEANHENETLNR